VRRCRLPSGECISTSIWQSLTAARWSIVTARAQLPCLATGDLSEAMIAALGDRNACLLANHGQIAGGATLQKALSVAEGVEDLADQYLSALTLGDPVILDADEMSAILKKFKTYGKQTSELEDGQTAAFELPRRVE
jgi:L-fuculose-phosphate aldolase